VLTARETRLQTEKALTFETNENTFRATINTKQAEFPRAALMNSPDSALLVSG